MTVDFTQSIKFKNFFRFTGPPENWLTAIKYMTWGLEAKYKDQWERIQPGDIFFIHSTGSPPSIFKNAKSGIIGIGVVGVEFRIKENYLWIHEFIEHRNKWPLLVPLSEIYLFSKLPSLNSWEAPHPDSRDRVGNLINALLRNHIPLSTIQGFPQMGSFSSVRREAAEQILFNQRPLHLYTMEKEEMKIGVLQPRVTELKPATSVAETFRYAETLQFFDSVKKRIIRDKQGIYLQDKELLAKAEEIHATILEGLLQLFKSKGYETMYNRHIDLFAYNDRQSFLFEVKSIENRNFRTQARKGIVQLFEYDYFEIRKFIKDKNLEFDKRHKILVPSRKPGDRNYVSFMNDLKLGVATIKNKSLEPVGRDLGFSHI